MKRITIATIRSWYRRCGQPPIKGAFFEPPGVCPLTALWLMDGNILHDGCSEDIIDHAGFALNCDSYWTQGFIDGWDGRQSWHADEPDYVKGYDLGRTAAIAIQPEDVTRKGGTA